MSIRPASLNVVTPSALPVAPRVTTSAPAARSLFSTLKADVFEVVSHFTHPAQAANVAVPQKNLGFEAVSSAAAAQTTATPKYNPAADLFPQLDWLNPLTYHPADPNKLSAQQPSEIQHMLDAQATRTPEQNKIAQDLAQRGTFSLWMDYANQYQKSHGLVAGLALKAKLAAALGADAAVDGVEKFKTGEKRPFQVDPRIHMLGNAPAGSSYPSGHAASSYAAATVLAEAMPDRANEFYSAAANVARSRVYMGVHFPGDVAAGARLGVKVGNDF